MVEAGQSTLPVREERIKVPGGKVWSKIVNPDASGTPLVFVHGGPGIPHNDGLPLVALADSRPVIFWDQLGCGKSGRPRNPELWIKERFVEEFHAVLEYYGHDQYDVDGYSWGGTLVGLYVDTYGTSDFRKILLQNPMFNERIVTEDVHRMMEALHPGALEILKKLEEAGKTHTKAYTKIIDALNQKHVYGERMDINNLPQEVKDSNKGFGKAVFKTMVGETEANPTGNLVGYDGLPALEKIDKPTLLIAGRDDIITPESVSMFADRIRRNESNPHVEVVVFEESAHMPQFTEQILYLDTVRNFLQ